MRHIQIDMTHLLIAAMSMRELFFPARKIGWKARTDRIPDARAIARGACRVGDLA